jgi:hypothetical protein
MAMNLEAVLRVAAKVIGLKEVTDLERAIGKVDKAALDMKTSFKGVVNSAAWQGAAIGAAGILAGLTMSIRAAIQFETAMADVRKVVSGLDTPEGMRNIREEIFALSREIPITAQGFAEMYAAAGSAGIAREELQAFAKDTAMVAVAFDMTAADAGTAMAKIRTNLGITQPELRSLADAVNHLSNSMASTAPQLVDFLRRTASQGKQAGLTAAQTAALGSAMIAAGAEAEVAGTSFNNMLRALTRGSSMTERQVQALVKLGYATAGAADAQRRLTQEAEEQGQRRVEAIERESRQVIAEIERRYRRLSQMQNDQADDEQRRWSRAQDDRYGAQERQLRRQQQAETDAAQARAEQVGINSRAEIDAIDERYERIRLALQRQQEDERIQFQRAARDRQEDLRNSLAERERLEKEAAETRFRELKRIEEMRTKEAKAAAAAAAKAITEELGPKLAAQMQKDAIGTIRDVFARIKALPKEMQMSVISDLFGDEARALAPLIENTQLFEKALGLVANKSQYAGSTLREFQSRISTTAADLQLAQNAMDELSIVMGEGFLDAVSAIAKALTPLMVALGAIAKIPVVGPLVISLAALASALVILAPGILSLIVILPELQVFVVALALPFIKLILVVGLVVGAFVLLYKALEAIWNNREAIGGFFLWLGESLMSFFKFIYESMGNFFKWLVMQGAKLGDEIKKFLSFALESMNNFFKWLVKQGANLGNEIKKFFTEIGNRLGGFVRWVQDQAYKGFQWVVNGARDGLKAIGDFATKIWTTVVDTIKGIINGMLRFVANGINSAINGINAIIQRINSLPSSVGISVQIPTIPQLSVPQFADGGIITRPTLAMVGEGGEPEYIIPASRMQTAAAAYQSGARGADVLAGRSSGQPVINITTGPVMRTPDGQDWVTTADLERAMRTTANAVLGRVRTPAGRQLLGIR